MFASAAGRTSRIEAGPVDLYAAAAAAAWQVEDGSALAPGHGGLPGPGSRSAPNQSSLSQPRSGSLPRTGSTPTTEHSLPHRPIPPAPRPAHVRLAQPHPPVTPPDQSHQQVQAAVLQPNHHITHAASSHARSDASDGAARLQSAVSGDHRTSMTLRGSEGAAQQSNQLYRQSTLPLNGTSAAQRSFAASEHDSQLPRSRYASA